MENITKTADYGYHVPHQILAGFVGAAVLLVAGVAIILAGERSPGFVAVAAVCIVAGGLLLAFTLGLRWLVGCGRPLMTERMLDTVSWTGAERVLDVGCGPGLALVGVAKRLTTGKAVGLDKWLVIHGEHHNSREVTLENARIEGVVDRIEVVDGDAGALPFADGSFDVVLSSFVFHHLPRAVRANALREAARVAKPGGRILITDEATSELVAIAHELGLSEVSNQRLGFPIHLLSARKPAPTVAVE